MKKTSVYFQYLDQPIIGKSYCLAFPETWSIRRPESRTLLKCQSTKFYHKLTQIKWSQVLHLVKPKCLRDLDFLFGLRGRITALCHFFPPDGRWQPVAALPEAGLEAVVRHWGSAWTPPHLEPWGARSAGPLAPISEAFVQELRGAFLERPSGTHRVRQGENNPCSFPPRGRERQDESCLLLGPEKQSGAFLGVIASGVTWGCCVHELSTTLVQNPDLNIGPGHCQLSSVTETPRGSSYGWHPSCSSLACVHQLPIGAPIPAPSRQLVTLSQHLPCSPAPRRRQDGAGVALPGGMSPQGHVSVSWYTAEQSSGCLNLNLFIC